MEIRALVIRLPPGIGTTVPLISASLSSENTDTEPTGIYWYLIKEGPQLLMLTSCALLCVLVSVALAPTWQTIFWTGAPWQFCATRSGKSAGNDCWYSLRWISIGASLCALKNFITDFTIGGSWNKSLQLQQLQRCYCENWGNPASACDMWHH